MMASKIPTSVGVLILVAIGAGILLIPTGGESPSDSDRPTSQPAVRQPPNQAALTVQRSDLGDAWPFTVERGVISCVRAGEVLFAANGNIYAVNGWALTNRAQKGYRDVAEIWSTNPAIPGAKVNIGPIINRGLALCRM
jgi:hypothetical protein